MVRDSIGGFRAQQQALKTYMRAHLRERGVFAALVISADGSDVDAQGSSDGLSSALDRAWLSVLRSRADAIVTTGATVRQESLRQPLRPLVVVSKSGAIEGLQSNPAGQLFVASDESQPDNWPPGTTWLGRVSSVADAVTAARKHWPNLAIEFGANQLRLALAAGVVDCAYVTAPNVQVVREHFGGADRLFEIDHLSVFQLG